METRTKYFLAICGVGFMAFGVLSDARAADPADSRASAESDAKVKVTEDGVIQIPDFLSEEEIAYLEGNDLVGITDNGHEMTMVIAVGEEMRWYLLVKDGERYGVAFELAIENFLGVGEGEETEPFTTVVRSNAEMLDRSIRLGDIRKAIGDGIPLHALDMLQAGLQESRMARTRETQETQETEGTQENQAVTLGDFGIDCGAVGTDTFCCGYQQGARVRIMCTCRVQGLEWVRCLDNGWASDRQESESESEGQ